MKTAKQLRAEAEAIRDTARAEGRPTTIEEEERQDALERRARMVEDDELQSGRERRLAAAIEHAQRQTEPTKGGTPATQVARIDRSGDVYRSAFAGFILGGHKSDLLPQAALQSDIADKGGYLAPPQFLAGVYRAINDGNPIRRFCNILPPTNAREVERPVRTGDGRSTDWQAEIVSLTDADRMRWGKRTLRPNHLAGVVEVSHGVLGAGGEMAVRGEIAHDAGETMERAFVVGNGIRQPVGLFFEHDAGVPASRNVVADPTTVAGWVALVTSLKARYVQSPSAACVLHRDALKLILAINTTAFGQPLWTPPARPGEFGRILGLTAILSEYAPTGTGEAGAYTTGDAVAVAGDLSHYDVQDSADMSIKRFDDSGYAARGVVGFMFRGKCDAAPRTAEAFSRLVVAA